jgi:RNA polymerase sigma-70 factor (ECF subfamily)
MGQYGSLGILQTVTTTAPIEDLELVSRFQNGDRAAFSELFRRHQLNVSRVIARMLGEPSRQHRHVAELEDLVQDVFVQVYRSLGTFRGNAKVTTWLYRIAVNVVLMHRRSARSRPVFCPDDDTVTPVSPEPIADDELVRNANVHALYRLLAQLSEKKRTVYILHEIEGLSAAEVAEIVGAPVLTVRTRLYYARRELIALLREDPQLAGVLEELETEEARLAQRAKKRLPGQPELHVIPSGSKTANGRGERS